MFLIEVLLPVYDNDGRRFSGPLYSAVKKELSERFGGVTAFARAPAEGFWKQDDGDVVKDDIVIFEVMAESLDRAWWETYRERLREQFRQDELIVRATRIETLWIALSIPVHARRPSQGSVNPARNSWFTAWGSEAARRQPSFRAMTHGNIVP